MVGHGDEKNPRTSMASDLVGPITIDKGERGCRRPRAMSAQQQEPRRHRSPRTSPACSSFTGKEHELRWPHGDFRGGVQAFQNEYSKLQCESLTAKFDKFVSFKEGQKENQNAKIDKILCDKNVFIDDSKVDERKQLAQRNVLMGTSMSVDNLEGGTFINGPGEVKTLGKGNAALETAPDPKAAPAKQEWKLTHVKFTQRMFSNTKSATKNAIFYGDNSGVEVFHFATTLINDKMNADKPGKDQLYLRCGILQVEGKQFVDRTTQYMVAKQNVEFQDKYSATRISRKIREHRDCDLREPRQSRLTCLDRPQISAVT